ncbi:unnamed protein product [Ambrosiozyma monospora]|uniref:Unnamed protein product n=1 Tax=Ambrosiozyma monospora TaxID=43982 RepID=A0A9W6Z057_AMBMO|nr:unnamed protein product [Ambrosiozyma monospora]
MSASSTTNTVQQQQSQQQSQQQQLPRPVSQGQAQNQVGTNNSVPSQLNNDAAATAERYRSLGIYNANVQPNPDSFGYSGSPSVSQTQLQQQQLQQQQNSQPTSSTINQQPFFYSEHAGSEFHSLTEFLSMIDDTEMMNSINLNNDPMLHKLETTSGLTYSNSNSTTNLNGQFDSSFFPNMAANSPQLKRLPSNHASQLALQHNLQQYVQSPQQQHAQVQIQNQQPNPQQIGYDFQMSQMVRSGLNSANQTQPVTRFGSTTSLHSQMPYISDSARDKFFLTAADPTTEISPEERLKQVIKAKLEAGLLRPYNYAKGYQRLQTYMDNHMASSSRSRILKPLSTFRPGFRAIAQTLKDLDLILVEENFERMLLDYDRVFTSMAIPACLWRRTGEIYRGNKEFASLVEVNIDDLKNGKLTIYELMTEESSVNFWEKYGAIAFDKTQKAVLTSCNLRTRDGRRKKNCCFSFTIRRDRYNIPSAIVANFIPIQ